MKQTSLQSELTIEALLASYPRSGRTWLAGMVSEVIRRSTPLPKGTRVFINEHSDKAIVEWNAQFDGPAPAPLRLATHNSRHEVPAAPHTVMIIRHPYDSLVSYFHYTTKHTEQFGGDIPGFLRSPSHGIFRLARWFNSWAPGADDVTVVSYETLRTNPGPELGRALAGLGVDHDEDLDAVANRWAFEKRQAKELERTGPTDADALFIRSGKVGGGREELTDHDISTINETLRSSLNDDALRLLTSHGYLDS